MAFVVSEQKRMTKLSQHDATDEWPSEVAEVIKATALDLTYRKITDQKAFEQLIAAGIPAEQARAILRTMIASATLSQRDTA